MKSTSLLAILLAGGVACASAENETQDSITPFIDSITLNAGLVHNQVKTLEDKSVMVAKILTGAELGLGHDIGGNERTRHMLNFSIGYYTGSETTSVLVYGDRFDYNSDLDLIPIKLGYNIRYALTDSISCYAVLHGGMMVRKTTINGSVTLAGDTSRWDNASCTKVLPLVGVGVGVQAYVSQKLRINIGYDFDYTFGDDCDEIPTSDGKYTPRTEYTSKDNRYYGTVKAGFTYSF